MSSFIEMLEGFQRHNIESRQAYADEKMDHMHDDYIFKTVSAMLEASVNEERIKQLLIKYWDMRPSDADFYLQNVTEEDN